MRKLFSVLSSTLQGGVRRVLLLLALFASVSAIYASNTKVGGIWYDFDSSTKTASVTYRGSAYDSYTGEYSGSVTIPETVTYNGTTYSVTSIGDDAFYYCSSLTSVTIPNSVTSIGDYAFFDCFSLTSVTIPNSVTSIGDWAFNGFSSLTSPLYNAHCFAYMPTSYSGAYTIPAGIEQIAGGAFESCYSLTSVTIPNSVISIGDYAFEDCSSLTSVTIPNSVTSIGNYAFEDCSSLTSVTIPNSVTSIGNSAFKDCIFTKDNFINHSTLDAEVNNYWGATIVVGDEINGLFIRNDTVIGCREYVTSVEIPNSVTSIGDYAFYYCFSLTAVTIPNSVTSIGVSAFEGCSSLTSVTIGESVTSIGSEAFYGCSSLTSVTIPNSVTSIGDYAFKGCSSLTSVTINSDPIVSKDYSSSSNLSHIFGSQVTEYIIGNSVTSIGDDAFYKCSSLTSVTIGESVKSIGKWAFNSCSSLTSMTIPNSVTSIGSSVFRNCSSLTSVTIPNSVTSIGDEAFYGCSSLTKTIYIGDIAGWCNIMFGSNYANPMYCSHNFYINDQEIKDLVIPNNVTSIGSYAFNGCSSLTSVTIPNSVISIGGSAFYDCSSLTKTNYTGDIAGWCNIKFYSGSANPMYCSHNFYINDQEIKDLVIPNSVTSIGGSAFYGCSSLTSVTIPNSVTSIGAHAFNSCSSLTSMTIPNSVTSIGSSAFKGCSSLTSVTIGESVTSIGGSAFYGCSSLTSVTIPNSVTSIGDDAFYKCSSLTSVTIPNSVTSIGYEAFAGCSSLTSITCEAATPPTLGSDAFDGVSMSIPVYVPCGCVEAYKAASSWSDFTNIQVPLLEYSIEVYVNDTIMGTANVDYNTFCEGNQISAKPNFGYHFVQWSDGNTDAIRTLELTQDTILTAEFAQSFSGQCGDDLYWSYDETAKTISITGSGKMYDYTATTQPWLLFKEQIVEVTTTNTVTSIGTSAFEGCIRLSKISLGTGLEEIAANAFAGCTRLYDIYTYATYPPFAEESSFANYNVYVYIPCEYQRDYILDVVWGKFKFIECIDSEEATTDGNVTVVPGFNDVTITWPTESNADTYTIVIKKGGEVFCTLTFNAVGQLLNIAFAPSRNGDHRPVQYAEQAINGFTFTITGLDEGSVYTYDLVVKDRGNNIIQFYSGEFRTWSVYDRTVKVEYDAKQGKVTGAGRYLLGETATLTAIPNEGYRFVRWEDGSTDNPRTLVIEQDTSLVAYFEIIYLQPDSVTLCYGETYQWHDKTYDASGVYVDTLSNGVATLYLTILPQVEETIEESTICAGEKYTWQADGKVYTESGIYSVTLQDINGCDSVVILHLTVNPVATTEETIIACYSYEWNNQTYTQSGEYTYTTTAANGCDSIVTLHLTINQTQYAEEIVTACDSYTWNGETYATTGAYTYTTNAANGCDSIVTLHLTILPDATTESETLALCPSELPYEWYGQSLTEEGTYSATEQYAGMECDSVIHELTLNVYVQTLPAAVTLPIVRTGEAIDVTIPTAEIQAHIDAETWYAPNAEVAWYIMENSDWAALSAEPVAAGITEVTLKYAVETDCGNIESDKMVINLKATDVENTHIQSPISNCQKFLRNGQLIILRDGVEYNAMGQEM